jgi:hypothetical protein
LTAAGQGNRFGARIAAKKTDGREETLQLEGDVPLKHSARSHRLDYGRPAAILKEKRETMATKKAVKGAKKGAKLSKTAQPAVKNLISRA